MPTKLKCNLSDARSLASEGHPEYVFTNAGCFEHEDNDCAIVALAIATDLPYKMIHRFASVCLGREPQATTLNMIYARHLYPFKFRMVNKKRFRLSTLTRRYPKGRYYVQIGGQSVKSKYGINGELHCHALAVVDGKIYDRHINPPDRWVTGVWKIMGVKPDSWHGWKHTDK
jgi:hypothetical protein